MGKDKLERFNENETFQNLFQPTLQYNSEQSELKGNWSKEFQNDNNIILELGCGRGEYTTGLASRNHNKNYIGVDIKGARLWRGAKTALENKLTNIKIWPDDIRKIINFFPPKSFSEVKLLFPDPWPKKKHQNRRLIQIDFINIIYKITFVYFTSLR